MSCKVPLGEFERNCNKMMEMASAPRGRNSGDPQTHRHEQETVKDFQSDKDKFVLLMKKEKERQTDM